MPDDISKPSDGATLAALRRFLLIALAVSLPGTLAELLLLEHTEDPWQWVPIVLLGLGTVVVAWHWFSPGRTSIRVLQGTMLMYALSGGVGVLLHFKGNVDWELESDATIGGFALFKAAMMGAVPSLAPGTMVLLAVVGLAYTFRHPALARAHGYEQVKTTQPGASRIAR